MRILLQLLSLVSALHPRPEHDGTPDKTASFARWLVHESDYGVISTFHDGPDGPVPFGNIISIADGEGSEDSTGVIYTYIPNLDATYQDLAKNPNVTITFSEEALENGTSGGCLDTTAENPVCGRVAISGQLTKVPKGKETEALKYLFATHPIMKGWSGSHLFEPFWMDPASITDFFVIHMFGGAIPITREQYFAAPWYRHGDLEGSAVCSVCGHVYNPDEDGAGLPFEDLPSNWTCPVCHAPKKAYRPSMVV